MSPESARHGRRGRRCRLPPVGRTPGATRRVAQRERLEDAEELVDPRGVAVTRDELTDGEVQRGGQRPAQRLVRAGLDLAGAPQLPSGLGAQRVEQHGLADAAQPGEHEAALGSPAGDALEHDVELRELPVAAGKLGRALPGAGRVRVPDGIHVEDCMAVSSRSPRLG
jgi:hypothetical protein